MLFASADYLVFLLAVYFLYSLLRATGGIGLAARVVVLILLGDLVYLILCKDLARLWDPVGTLVFSLLLDEPPSLRAPLDYVVGCTLFAGAFLLSRTRGAWFENKTGRSIMSALWGILLIAIGVAVLFAFQVGELESLSLLIAEHGHLLFLFGFGIALGAGLSRETQRFGRVALLFIVSVIFYHAWAAGMHGGYLYLVCLILATIVLDFYLALWIDRSDKRWWRLTLLVTSLVTNLGVLALFKYVDFFIAEINSAGAHLGVSVDMDYLGLILPAGISFHTFQSLSYTIDVYRKSVAATRSILHLATYVLFFPQLIAGPIVRAHEFLPQIEKLPPIVPEHAAEGLYRIMVGLFKKVALSDVIAMLLTDAVFSEPSRFSSVEVLLGVYGYAFQIYLDFSAYSDIAIGSAKLLGFKFPENFNTPYRSGNLQEFWRRWHITLSSWLRDYLYVPLGGSRGKPWRTYPNLMITMLLGGLWHGANWTFIVWGTLHGGGLIATRVFQRRIRSSPSSAPRLLLVTLALLGLGLMAHSQLWHWFGDDSPWLHLALLWAYATPCWAAATAWLTAGPMPVPPESTWWVWKGPGLGLRLAWVVTTALLGLALWKGPTDFWPLLLLLWLGLAVAGDILRGSLATSAADLARRAAAVTLTFHYVCLAWIFFRATDFSQARDVLWQLFEFSTDAINASPGFRFVLAVAAVSHLIPPGAFLWLKEAFVSLPPLARAVVMALSAFLLSELARTDAVPFIYFQF